MQIALNSVGQPYGGLLPAPRGGRRAARARAGGMMAAPTILLNPPEDSDQIQNSVRIPNEIR